jgi:hypothetical protein
MRVGRVVVGGEGCVHVASGAWHNAPAILELPDGAARLLIAAVRVGSARPKRFASWLIDSEGGFRILRTP